MDSHLKFLTGIFLVTVIVMLGSAVPARSQLRLSFEGYRAPAGWFDETATDTLYLDLGAMVGPPHPDGSNSMWYLKVYSASHELHGFPRLEDTEPYYNCVSVCAAGCYYQINIWLRSRSHGGEPLLVGTIYGGVEGTTLEGLSWNGREPTEFTDILFQFVSHTCDPLKRCVRGLTIPIVWVLRAVPVERTTWGRVKSRFE